jgi:hypothetical protein
MREDRAAHAIHRERSEAASDAGRQVISPPTPTGHCEHVEDQMIVAVVFALVSGEDGVEHELRRLRFAHGHSEAVKRGAAARRDSGSSWGYCGSRPRGPRRGPSRS